jgi:hypothetical protein
MKSIKYDLCQYYGGECPECGEWIELESESEPAQVIYCEKEHEAE